VLALSLSLTGSAAAQGAPEDREAAARTLGDEGLRRFNAARWQEAYTLFERAYALYQAPTLLLYMGHCRARLGDLVGARRLYKSVAAETLPGGSSLQFQTAQGVARELLASLRPRLFLARIVVTGARAGGAVVVVDGAEVPASELEDVAMEPGEHMVSVSVVGGPAVLQRVSATAGGTAEILLSLDPTAPATPAAPTSPVSQPDREAPPQAAPAARGEPRAWTPPTVPGPPSTPRLLVPMGVAFGAGGALLIAGGITGAVSLRTAADVKSHCGPGGVCPISQQANADRAGQLADASTGTLVAGGIALAVGVVLAVVDHRRPRAEAVAVRIGVGPAGGAVGGRF
jgi:hypothetical protein